MASKENSSAQYEIPLDDNEENKSSLSKTIGNVLTIVNDGLYRLKNRSKAERLFDDNVESNELKGDNQQHLLFGKQPLVKQPQAGDAGQKPSFAAHELLVEPSCSCIDTFVLKRYQIAILASIGFIISFGIRGNLGSVTPYITTTNETKRKRLLFEPEFQWSSETVGVVHSSFFWGYLVTQIPGGFLAARYPANQIFGSALAISSFLNLLQPLAMNAGSEYAECLRVFQGLAEGVTYPACHGIWRHWAPPMEKSRLATLAFCGSYAGLVVGMPLMSVLMEHLGWQAPFYFYGVVGLIWYVFWTWLSSERPSKHPSISKEELEYIETSIGRSSYKPPTFGSTPWRAILTSKPVWAINVANFCRSWTFYLLINSQRDYMRKVFDLEITDTGFLAALPHLCMTSIVPVGGQLADYLLRTGKLTTTQVRKLFNCGGFGVEALFLIFVGMSASMKTSLSMLTLAVGFSGFAISGYNVNHLDIAPHYAAILMGISNGIGTIAAMLCPIIVQYIASDSDDKKVELAEWDEVFLMSGGIHFAGVIFYYFFASGELQPWAEPKENEGNGLTASPTGEPATTPTSHVMTTSLDAGSSLTITKNSSMSQFNAQQVPSRPNLPPRPQTTIKKQTTRNNFAGSRDDSA